MTGAFRVQTEQVRTVAGTVEGASSSAASAAGELSSMVLNGAAFGQFGSAVAGANQSLQQQLGESLRRVIELLNKINGNVRSAAAGYDAADADVAHGYGADATGAGATGQAPQSEYGQIQQYMFNEMRNNSKSDTVSLLKSYNAEPSPFEDPAGVAGRKTAAYALWAWKVQPGGVWDHKKAILGMTAGDNWFTPMDGLAGKQVRYDLWSNVHYGYVGVEAGFSEGELHGGANLADYWTQGKTDAGDQASIQLGMDLRKQYTPDQLTPQIIQQAIVNRAAELERTGMIVPQNYGGHP